MTKMMQKLTLLIMVVLFSCNSQNTNGLAGTWQLIRKSNDRKVIFRYDPEVDPKKFIYWFKDDSVLITKDDDGGNMQVNKYTIAVDRIVIRDSFHTNTFFFKIAGGKLSMKSIYSPFNLELKKLN
jgi:hypothetical protein